MPLDGKSELFQEAQAGNLGCFFQFLYNQSMVPKFEITSFEEASNDCIVGDKSLQICNSVALDISFLSSSELPHL